MALRRLTVALLLVGFVATCVATKGQHNHRAAMEARKEAEERAFNPLGMIKDALNPTTKAPRSSMLVITRAANAAINTVDSVTGSLTGMIARVKSVQSMAKSAAEETIQGMVDRAETLARKQGGEPGCVTELMGRAGGVILEVALEEVECPGNKIGKLEDMLETLVLSGQAAIEIVPKAALELDKCERKGGPLELFCSAKVAKDMVGRASSVGMQAAKLATEAAEMVATIEPSLVKCATTKAGTATARAAKLMGKLGVCSGKAVKDLLG